MPKHTPPFWQNSLGQRTTKVKLQLSTSISCSVLGINPNNSYKLYILWDKVNSYKLIVILLECYISCMGFETQNKCIYFLN